jgi:hypothetical protein
MKLRRVFRCSRITVTRVIRGGGARRVAFRYGTAATSSIGDIGLRLSKSIRRKA